LNTVTKQAATQTVHHPGMLLVALHKLPQSFGIVNEKLVEVKDLLELSGGGSLNY